jgi:hypothetical protein
MCDTPPLYFYNKNDKSCYPSNYKTRNNPDDRTICVIPTQWDLSRSKRVKFDDYRINPAGFVYTFDSIINPNQRLQFCLKDKKESMFELPDFITVDCFTNSNKWPLKTDLCCWWCTCQFDTIPISCPYYRMGEHSYKVRGVFCSPSCAKAWVIDVYSKFSKQDLMLEDMIFKMKNGIDTPKKKGFNHITPAPSRELLKKFCGPQGLSIEEFRSLSEENEIHVIAREPIYITHKMIIEAQKDVLNEMRSKRIIHNERNTTIKKPSNLSENFRKEAHDSFLLGQDSSTVIFKERGLRKLNEFF